MKPKRCRLTIAERYSMGGGGGGERSGPGRGEAKRMGPGAGDPFTRDTFYYPGAQGERTLHGPRDVVVGPGSPWKVGSIIQTPDGQRIVRAGGSWVKPGQPNPPGTQELWYNTVKNRPHAASFDVPRKAYGDEANRVFEQGGRNWQDLTSGAGDWRSTWNPANWGGEGRGGGGGEGNRYGVSVAGGPVEWGGGGDVAVPTYNVSGVSYTRNPSGTYTGVGGVGTQPVTVSELPTGGSWTGGAGGGVLGGGGGDWYSSPGGRGSAGPGGGRGGFGIPGGIGLSGLGQGSAGNLPGGLLGRLSANALKSGGNPALGLDAPGNAVVQYASALGRANPHSAAFSTLAPYLRPNTAFAGPAGGGIGQTLNRLLYGADTRIR